MSENKSALTSEQKQKCIDWLTAKGAVGKPCHSCGKGPFVVADHLVASSVFRPGGGITIGGASYPMFMVICENCGSTRMFSALMAGILSLEDSQDGES